MPTGFDVETGSNLSPRLQSCVPVLTKYLKHQRELGRGPGNPIMSPEIESHFLSFNWKIPGSDIRAMVNYLRRNKNPIGSNAGGYFWAINRNELNFTVNHMEERVRAILAAIVGLKRSFDAKEETLI